MTIYLSENIKRLRREKGITQENLADFLGVTFQSVSKWERGESYPDITMLPEIAGFFRISVDELLGVNKATDEVELTKLLEEYDNLRWDAGNKWKVLDEMREKYPADFRVQVRYIGKLLNGTNDEIVENRSKITAMYENIQRNCTDDPTRIEAKNYYISFLLRMIPIKDSGVTFEQVDKIIRELPSIRYGRELNCFTYEYYRESTEEVHKTLEILIHSLYDVMSEWFFHQKVFPVEYQIEMQENIIRALDYIYSDGNYGLMWTAVIFSCYGIMAMQHYQKNDFENALVKLRKAAELAVKFDSLERFTTMHSPLFEGRIFDKHTCNSDFTAKENLKEYMLNGYGFSDEFKSTAEFKEIFSILE